MQSESKMRTKEKATKSPKSPKSQKVTAKFEKSTSIETFIVQTTMAWGIISH